MSTRWSTRPDVRPDASRQMSAGDLVGAVGRDMSQLVRQEMQLARAELRQDAKETGQAAGAFGGAAFAGYMVLLFGSIAGWWALSRVMNQGWASLVIAGVWALIALILAVAGRGRMRHIHGPQRAAQTVREVPDALRGRSRP